MKIGIKEAYEMAKKTFAGSPYENVKVTVQFGKGYSWEDEGLRWVVTLTDPNNDQKSEADAVFAIALARLSAELERGKAVEPSDVLVDDEPAPEEPSSEGSGSDTATF